MTASQILDAVSGTASLRLARARLRTERRERAVARAHTRIDREAVPNPLLREEPRRDIRTAGLFCVAISVHVLLVVVGMVFPPGAARPRKAYEQPVEVRVVEPPKAEQPPPPPVSPPPEVLPPPKSPPPAPPPIKQPVETKDPPPPPPDPVEPAPAPAEPSKEAPRRIVGLSLESTTTAGAGEAFAVGNSRMGQTAAVAEDPTKVAPLTHTYVPPRRTRVYVPPYPAALRGRRLHGEVGLRVDIDAQGTVTGVTVTRPSAYAEFNAAASDAATRCAYEPARLDGAPVARSIDINVQFQPND